MLSCGLTKKRRERTQVTRVRTLPWGLLGYRMLHPIRGNFRLERCLLTSLPFGGQEVRLLIILFSDASRTLTHSGIGVSGLV